MIEDIRRLLCDWGDWMRSEKGTPRGIGYPEQAVGAEMMDTPSRRSANRETEVHRIAHIARQTAVYRTNDSGLKERVVQMIPRSQPKDSRGRRNRSPDYEPAPREILSCHDAVKATKPIHQDVLCAKYVAKMRSDHAARSIGITTEYFRRLAVEAEKEVEWSFRRRESIG